VAAQYDRKEFIGLLVSVGAPVEELNEEGETPIQVAFKMVVALSCKVNWPNPMFSVQGNSNAMKALIRRGASIPDDDEEFLEKLKAIFLASVFDEIKIPPNTTKGARMWDMIENFAKQRRLPSY